MATETKPNRSEAQPDAAPSAPPAAAEPVSPSGIPLRDLPGWDVERGGIVHQDPGKRALDLINEESARRRTSR